MKQYETMSEKLAFSYLGPNLLRDLAQVFSNVALSFSIVPILYLNPLLIASIPILYLPNGRSR